jgi:Fe-S cluster assembly scaffold protein SufB
MQSRGYLRVADAGWRVSTDLRQPHGEKDMTDITERLRSIYVAEGTNYVQEAADLIDKLRAELDRAKEHHAAELADITAERDQLVNDVHSCHNNCTKAGCVNRRLRDALQGLFDVDMEYFLMGDGKDDQVEAIAAAKAALEQKK